MRKVQAAIDLYEAEDLLNARLEDAKKLGLKVEAHLYEADGIRVVGTQEIKTSSIVKAEFNVFEYSRRAGMNQ